MSWVVFDDAFGERMVAELQPTVVEVFKSRGHETSRLHLALLRIAVEGPDTAGTYRISLTGVEGRGGTQIQVHEPAWQRLWPWIEQVRQAQVPYMTY